MRVIDACAGAGGKSLHIAALMQSKGKLLSMDVEQYKLEELKKINTAILSSIVVVKSNVANVKNSKSKTVAKINADAQKPALR